MKKRHTPKTEIVVTAAGRIAAISAPHPDSHPDLMIRRKDALLPEIGGEGVCMTIGLD